MSNIVKIKWFKDGQAIGTTRTVESLDYILPYVQGIADALGHMIEWLAYEPEEGSTHIYQFVNGKTEWTVTRPSMTFGPNLDYTPKSTIRSTPGAIWTLSINQPGLKAAGAYLDTPGYIKSDNAPTPGQTFEVDEDNSDTEGNPEAK